jgi:hypothetical protein
VRRAAYLAALLITACSGSGSAQSPELTSEQRDLMLRSARESDALGMRGSVKVSVEFVLNFCGGDPYCDRPSWRGEGNDIRVQVEDLSCTPGQLATTDIRNCRFNVRKEGSAAEQAPLACTIAFHSAPGHHFPYWSDDRRGTARHNPPPPPPGSPEVPSMPKNDSTVDCSPALATLIE